MTSKNGLSCRSGEYSRLDRVAGSDSGWHRLTNNPYGFRDMNRTKWLALLWVRRTQSPTTRGLFRDNDAAGCIPVLAVTGETRPAASARWRPRVGPGGAAMPPPGRPAPPAGQHRVDDGDEDLGPVVAERARGGRRAAREPDRSTIDPAHPFGSSLVTGGGRDRRPPA